MKSLVLVSKPQVLKNCPVLGSRTALFFVPLKSCWKTLETLRKICKDLFLFSAIANLKKIFEDPFFLEISWKTFFCRSPETIFSRPFFMEDTCRLCPWTLALASKGTVFGRAVLGLGLGFFCVLSLGLVSSAPLLVYSSAAAWQQALQNT